MTIRSHQGYSCYWEEMEVENRADYCAIFSSVFE